MPIRILPSDLSSQISAGEIIERPASVVKEIIENSIDAGAKNINIVIEKSGFQSIMLNDDGCGIHKKELLLAVCHHATSKINSLSDLDKLTTFGFRGEALASIRAVSRLTLISSNQLHDIAWKIYLEGFSSNHIAVQPIAHPQGTTVLVESLFYNMPVRLKFLKNKKLEFIKILEIVKKIALSYFHINFSLKHNNRLIVQYNSINHKKNKINRLKDILNIVDINQFIEITEKKYNLHLFGWIANPYNYKKLKKIQYCYINNRYVYNNIFMNAVRSAYYKISVKIDLSFILYLNISPSDIDVNIHPSKSEIKFHKPNVVYTFIYQTLLYHLKKYKKQYFLNNNFCEKQNNAYQQKQSNLDSLHFIFFTLMPLFFLRKNFSGSFNSEKKYNHRILNISSGKYQCSIGKLLIITHKYYGLIYNRNNFSLISFPLAKAIVRREKLQNDIKQKSTLQCFLSNIKVNITSQEHLILLHNKEILLKIGFHLIFEKKYVILSSIPIFLKKRNIYLIISDFFAFLFFKKQVLISEIINWFYINVFIESKNWTRSNGIAVLLEMEYFCPLLLINPPPKLLQKININRALCMLKI
ncbi:DNA mismatch repair endonuclease MutL [Buchnera aphidicola]|uniref:DNA mismatch repair protein MutL n=1 Tax=Buchnera aphidicola (Macrosiphum gaurae) TaxID=2315801 RepID=A0A4D6Y2Q5_9GAMM|nr:DNA mismatch repair endonuclease MutL [Buchnera aphidicola]QCI22993.1 DNA mismatch repair endonuclease MutL [Buchnera aphidicola (Macrosiphum gaurae)]